MQIFHSGHQNNLIKQQNAIYHAKTQQANFPVWTPHSLTKQHINILDFNFYSLTVV